MSYTKGEWGLEICSDDIWIGPLRADGIKVNEIVTHINNEDELKDEVREKNLANAKLIAAAPDLLEALQLILKEYSDKMVEMKTPIAYFKAFNKAMEAIKKATA